MSKTLYILGAGASAQVHPLIKSFIDEKGESRKSLQEELLEYTKIGIDDNTLIDYHNLCIEAENFSTPDTFAKFLYSSNRDIDYKKFKIVISSYFFWKEYIGLLAERKIDKRILSFLSTITKRNGEFPDNIKLLTWNYDCQFLKSIKFLIDLSKSNSFLHNFSLLPLAINHRNFKSEKISLLHLNGIAGYSKTRKESSIRNKVSEYKELNPQGAISAFNYWEYKNIIDLFSKSGEDILISYAWEDGSDNIRQYPQAEDRIEHALAMTKDTEILVVIGYSFPYFNREIDKAIFSSFKNLKKIYYQDPCLDGQFLLSQFNLDKDKVSIEHIKDTSNYFIPMET